MAFLSQMLSLGGFSEQKYPSKKETKATSVYATGEVFGLSSPDCPFTAHFGLITIEILS